MKSTLFSGLGIAALSMMFSGLANAQTENSPADLDHSPPVHQNWGYVTHGKHVTREIIPPTPSITWTAPATQAVETGSSVPKPGDYYVEKVVGKHTERVLVHNVAIQPESTTNDDGSPKSSYAYFQEGKHTERREFHLADKARVFRGEEAARAGSGRH